jgi:CBS domain containing-hemolysin-like protein
VNKIAGYDYGWLAVALVLLAAGMYVAVSRQLLALYSRKRLLELTPEGDRKWVEGHLDHYEDHVASLRSVDLLLRMGLVLSLTFGRLMASGPPASFRAAVIACLRLTGEMLVLYIVCLELIPAIIARVHTENRLIRRFRAIHAIHLVVTPFRSVITRLVRWAVKLSGGKVDRPSADILEEEILSAAEEGQREGLLKAREIDMIESIISFGNVEVTEVMTPRTEMVCLDADETLPANLKRAIECGHSRIPIYKTSKDNITGILYVKDLLRYWDRKEAIRLEEIARKPHFVPLTKKIRELFQEFRTQRFHIAIILDEFGGTSGLITIEDIIEEIVGEIQDEHEKVERPPIKRLAADLVEVDGSVHIDDLNDQVGLDLPEGDAYDTVGGFLSARMGKIPSAGEAFDLDTLRFEVTSADGRRIRRLKIRLPAPAGEPVGEKDVEEAKAPSAKEA